MPNSNMESVEEPQNKTGYSSFEHQPTLEEILDDYEIIDTSHIYHHEHDSENLKAALERREERLKETLLDALYEMYLQYCGEEGHDFMGAGEHASGILEEARYIEVDNLGRIVKDKQQLKTLDGQENV